MNSKEKIEEIKQITLGELRNTIVPRLIRELLEQHSVVIFYALNDLNGAGGSGTLINYKGIKGILTATHVVAPLSDRNSIFLPCSLREGTKDVWDVVKVPCHILTIDDLSMYATPEWLENWSENGLDISLIQIEDQVFNEIIRSWGKQPIDLAAMQAKYYSQEDNYWSPEKKCNWTWTIAGVPREGCRVIEENVNYFPNAAVYIGGGITHLRINTIQNVYSQFKGKDVDIIETQIGPTLDSLPKDFSGASGGGIYQTSERQIGNGYVIDDFLLAGVFVAANEANGLLLSRGHISLYDVFCTFLDHQLEKKL